MTSRPPIVRAAVALPLLLALALGTALARKPASAPDPPNDDDSWRRDVCRDIANREYHASVSASGLLQAPNRAQNLRSRFHATGISVVPRDASIDPPWRFEWRLRRLGRPGSMQEVAGARPSASRSRVTYERGELDEWYDNAPAGLEQGFDLAAPPPGEGLLVLEGEIVAGGLSAEPDERGDAVDFLDADGARVLRYGELRVEDATGRDLRSRLELASGTLAIVIEDAGAVYPIAVDPLLSSPAWTAESNQAASFFGYSVATAGDVNGDGFSDVIVGALGYDGGEADEGRAFVYHGSPGGLAAAPAWTKESNQAGASFGISVATAGDVNGDGFADVVVGAAYYDGGQVDEGRAYVYHGSATGLGASAAWAVESNQASAAFGEAVATAGDVNGDGFADVIVGAHGYDDGGTPAEGRAWVYHGSAAGLGASAAWTDDGGQAGARFGVSVATAGDVNGDGFSDVIVGARAYDNGQSDEGRAFVYHGSAGGLGTSPAWRDESNQANAGYGYSVAGAGDVNGDGFADVVIGSPFYSNTELNEGRAFVYHGSAAGLGAAAAWTAESNQVGAQLGVSVATAGDVGADGFADVIIGAHSYDNGQADEGRALVYEGSAGGLATLTQWTAESNQAASSFGYSVATAGDVNGDGFSDVIVGAYRYDNGQANEGRAVVYLGSGAGPGSFPGWTAESDQMGSWFGYSVATAGDVNGDGFSDVIVGAAHYDNDETDEGRAFVYLGSAAGPGTSPAWMGESDLPGSEFGRSVASAGDVNGDGFSDVIVGAYFANRALVYHGSAAGLGASPAWTAQAAGYFGWSVATAGDVNGDGFSDVVIGAVFYTNGELEEGGAFVYHGSAGGLGASPAWSAESNQFDGGFGWSVATAGDVNGDGFSDVIVGARLYDNGQSGEGKAFVYHGSPGGLEADPAWTAEPNQAGAFFGTSVGTAGDVNGDGFSDVIVGAPLHDNGEIDEGRAYYYPGSAAGLALDHFWTAESNQPLARLGEWAGTAGDVNGDGFSDIVAGAPYYDNGESQEGRAFLFLGTPTGPATTPVWTAESDQAGAELGHAVATAGDVNGDGFDDVIIGAWMYDNGQTDEGQAFVYLANAGSGPEPLSLAGARGRGPARRAGSDLLPAVRLPRQARADDTALIALLGRSDSESAFRLKAIGRSPEGRGRVGLQWEVKRLGDRFDGRNLGASPLFDTGTGSVELNELVTGLTADTPYHWRLRILTVNPFFPRSPWFSPPGNGPGETDLRTAGGASAVIEAPGAAPPRLHLEPARPSPFGRRTALTYTLPQAGRVRLAVYDVQGRERAVLVDAAEAAGRHVVRWDGRDARGAELASGVYVVRLGAAGLDETRKIILAR